MTIRTRAVYLKNGRPRDFVSRGRGRLTRTHCLRFVRAGVVPFTSFCLYFGAGGRHQPAEFFLN